ncbi:Gfo/Idh/MocA family oxidoreductase (plasmid) [Halobaculum sp. CBA1158]|uniref:D-xylose 1-dehydrogenase Gfo6 n=1 Tax=Halobaculum sp. CBA1158 TaxID=2904243 RepID=UPI001F22C3D7|nr:D-xylose 1-dehydrogenase Gfo6 [Halobaculum sp. CBA1158]UIP01454.1 Gfo/Idh/MocA family oxidoreductase [Halobaculum sp. CBA1158]
METRLADYVDDFTRRDWQTLDPDAVGDPIRIAVVGAGWFTRDWALPGIERSAFTEATVVTDIDAEAVETVADDHRLTGVTPAAFRAGDAADEYDAVYVATPNATHPEYVEAAAEQGKAVLCEKPMAATVEGAERIVDACEAAGVPLMVGYRMQTDPAVRRVRELLAGGFVGDAVHVHASMSQTMLGELSSEHDQWRLDPELSGGCALMDLGVYPLNTTRFVLGEDPVAASGRTRSEHAAFDGVDEHAAYRLSFPGGVDAACTVSQNAGHASRFEVTGTDGRLILDPAFYEREAREFAVERDGTRMDVTFEQVHQLAEEFAYFGHHLLAGEPFGPDGRHGLVDARALDAIYESAESGARVSLDG